jgi:uncharacterized membrane protein YcjF (UPF0283 family)
VTDKPTKTPLTQTGVSINRLYNVARTLAWVSTILVVVAIALALQLQLRNAALNSLDDHVQEAEAASIRAEAASKRAQKVLEGAIASSGGSEAQAASLKAIQEIHAIYCDSPAGVNDKSCP